MDKPLPVLEAFPAAKSIMDDVRQLWEVQPASPETVAMAVKVRGVAAVGAKIWMVAFGYRAFGIILALTCNQMLQPCLLQLARICDYFSYLATPSNVCFSGSRFPATMGTRQL